LTTTRKGSGSAGSLSRVPPHRLAGAALDQHVVRHHDGAADVDLQQRLDVLEEVQLFVLGRRREVPPSSFSRSLGSGLGRGHDERETRLLETHQRSHDQPVVENVPAEAVESEND